MDKENLEVGGSRVKIQKKWVIAQYRDDFRD